MTRRGILLAGLGFVVACGAAGTPVTAEIQVRGMVCESCVEAIEHEVGRMEGVARCTVDLEAEKATVEFDSGKVALADITAKIQKLGYEAQLAEG